MAIWQDLVSDHGFAGGYQTVKRFVRKLRRPRARSCWNHPHRTRTKKRQVDYGSGPMVRDPEERQIPSDAIIRDDPWLQSQIRTPAGVAFEFARLGRAA